MDFEGRQPLIDAAPDRPDRRSDALQPVDPRYRPDRAAGHRFLARPFGADRRDRRRQIHPARRAVAGARRARRRLAGAPWRGAGPGDGRLRRAAQPSGPRAPCRERARRRRRHHPAPRADGRRPHPRLRQRPAVQRHADARHRPRAGRDPRPARRARAGRRGGPPRPARRLRRACRRSAAVAARRGGSGATAEQELARHRAKVEAAAREADYLRASVAELVEARSAARRGDRACRTSAPP